MEMLTASTFVPTSWTFPISCWPTSWRSAPVTIWFTGVEVLRGVALESADVPWVKAGAQALAGGATVDGAVPTAHIRDEVRRLKEIDGDQGGRTNAERDQHRHLSIQK